ncbi:MAG: hypothetical protein Q4D16_08410 [Eubacteriales bacterium]|nr:hypothetical protein [Eubacteriales bacterium]
MDEKMRILKMLEDGKVTAEQAMGLLNAMGENASEESAGSENAGGTWMDVVTKSDTSYENKMLRIVVDSPTGDKVNVQLPVKIIRQVLKVTGKLPIQGEGMQNIDLESLTASVLECLDNETLGNIVDVNAADGTTVRVFIG